MEDWEKRYVTGEKPWDLGKPEKELVRLVESRSIQAGASALELGCGTGTDAIYLAKEGFRVVGVDCSPTAVALAREKAKREKPVGSCKFYLNDACDLTFLTDKFSFAYDKTCFDNLDPSKRATYVRSVRGVLEPAARFLVMVIRKRGKGLTKEDLRNLFGAEFLILSFEKTKLKHVGHDHSAWKLLLEANPQ